MSAYFTIRGSWCRKSDSNRHVSRRQLLRLLWLPITSFRHIGPLCKVATSASSLRRDDFFSPTTDKKMASAGWLCPQQPLPFSNERSSDVLRVTSALDIWKGFTFSAEFNVDLRGADDGLCSRYLLLGRQLLY